jgi:hypothetical protein
VATVVKAWIVILAAPGSFKYRRMMGPPAAGLSSCGIATA